MPAKDVADFQQPGELLGDLSRRWRDRHCRSRVFEAFENRFAAGHERVIEIAIDLERDFRLARGGRGAVTLAKGVPQYCGVVEIAGNDDAALDLQFDWPMCELFVEFLRGNRAGQASD